MSLECRPISAEDHLAFIKARGSASFLQTPAWGRVKREWRSESVGFFSGAELTGVALVLYRHLPVVKRSLAYLPEGPVLDWGRSDLSEHFTALTTYARRSDSFVVRIGPWLPHRRWNAATIKDAVADEAITVLSQKKPDEVTTVGTQVHDALVRGGWIYHEGGEGFAVGQPQFNFQVPLRHRDGTQKSEDELLKGMNQLWRRNIKKATKEGVTVRTGTREDLPAFHRIYLETAERDGFTGRQLDYFELMWDVLNSEDPDRMKVYLAEHEGDLVAATTMVTVGEHAWYSYGASTSAKREVRGSNAVQWQMLRDANTQGCAVYDMRGIVEGVGADHPEIGLIQFKVGTGGEAVAYLGEWDYVISKPLYWAFNQYLKRR